ncbi:hypothetical protein [Pseudomonas sp. EMN2]|uniref:hypothetical protein n=1 Tax=Pseudomonas sp. EMN2 TaxID=2615212 RepID=UPI0015B3C419|nr:hypothetical protein [Pseudomonas sp. EMN2]
MTKTQYQLDKEARYRTEGFTIMDEERPAIGKRVEAIRVFQPRGLGGVILGTEYKIVPIIRTSEHHYTDTLNKDTDLVYSAFEGWRELQTYADEPDGQERPPTVFDPLQLPEAVHAAAVEMLRLIGEADTSANLDHHHARADSFVLGLDTGRCVSDEVAGKMWLYFERAKATRLAHLKDQQPI